MSSARAGLGRRELFKGAVAAGLTAGLLGPGQARAKPSPKAGMPWASLPDRLQAPPASSHTPGTESFWNDVRRAFPLSDGYIHMNTGTTGSQPLFSLNNLAVYNLWKSQDPRDWQANLADAFPGLWRTLAQRQAAVAATYGANANEIILSYNTSDACNLIFAGTPWKSGDRIITTTMEHPGMVGPLCWARDYHDVDVAIVEIPTRFTYTVDEFLSWFDAELAKPLPSGAKQYVAFSEITYKNGMRLPVQEIAALARSYGAYTICDTAHGWGMLPIDCHAYGVDFLAGAGHKWLCGGPGTGILYVRHQGTDLPPWSGGNWPSYGNLFVEPSVRYDDRNAWAPASIQGRGETNTPALYAMTDSASFFAQIGVENIYLRGLALAGYLQQKIVSQWGPEAITVQSPDPRYKTMLTSFNPFQDRNDPARFADFTAALNEVVARLAAGTPKVYIRTVTWRERRDQTADDQIAFRVSTHAMYINWDDIDEMFAEVVRHVEDVARETGLPLM